MDGRDMLKELAKRAKNRLSGKQGKKQDNIRYINQKNVIETVLIKEDTAFNQKVKEIIEKDSICPLNELINFAYYKTLSKEQKEAVKSVFENRVSIITGGPGTGKTTIIKMLIKLFKYDETEFALCAPTGRAAKRITETTGEEAKTLHRFLELRKSG